MDPLQITEILAAKQLKITPQRIAVLRAVYTLKNHPTAEEITRYIKKNHPNIAIGTVYNILETLVQKNIIHKVKTNKDLMRYDGILENHHHLYCSETDRIEDYFDSDLDKILQDYFKKKKIPDFNIENIKLHLIGKFNNNK